MKFLNHIIITLTILVLSSCNDFEGDDPNVHGTWSSGLQTYYFNADKTYSYTNNFSGDSINPVYIDSVFGTYTIDTRRSNISMSILGYKLDSNNAIVNQALNGTTWNYSISDDKMDYTSNTSAGTLDKQ